MAPESPQPQLCSPSSRGLQMPSPAKLGLEAWHPIFPDLASLNPLLCRTPLFSLQVVPPRVTEPHQRPVPWDVRAVSVEAAVTPAEPHARVLFHLKGQDWPPGPGSLPCARLHAIHPAGTAHRACHFQVSGRALPKLARPAVPTRGRPWGREERAYHPQLVWESQTT